MNGIDVVTLGECMLALRCEGSIRLGAGMHTSIAGAEANVAIGLARLGHASRWLGRVGADESGELIKRILRAEQVQVDGIVVDRTAATGVVIFERPLPGVTRVEYHRQYSAGSRLDASDVAELAAGGARVLHVTGVTAALSATALSAVRTAVECARAAGLFVSLDLNFRQALWDAGSAATALRPLAEQADVVFGSEDELSLVAESGEALAGRGPREVIVKLGERGAIAYSADRPDPVARPACRVPVVDSVGAGDAFCAGYLSAWLDDHDLAGRLERANNVAAFALATRGDWEGLPRREELALVKAPAGTALR